MRSLVSTMRTSVRPKLRTLRAGATVLTLCLVAPAGAAGVGSAAEVTIRAHLTPRGLELEGTIANKAAGETVDLQAKDCGPGHHPYRLVAGTRTLAGGVWRIGQEAGLPSGPSASYFRARWRGHFSEPALVRYRAAVTATWRARTRTVTVAVSTWFSGQTLRGRFVELQRRVEGTEQWVRVRRARLGPAQRSRGLLPGLLFKTQFSVPKRGLTLRVFVPAQTGAPCFAAGVSASWRS
jgi:hypothetical protein